MALTLIQSQVLSLLFFIISESQGAAQLQCRDVEFKLNPLHLAVLNDNPELIEKIEQIDFRLKNQRDYRGRRPFQFVEVDSSSAAKKLVTNRSRDYISHHVAQSQAQFSFIDNSDRRYELDTVLRSVRNELAPLEKARQRSTYEFCTRGQVSRNSDKFETKTYVYKR